MPDLWWEKDMREARRGGFAHGLAFGLALSVPLWVSVIALLVHFQ